MKIFYSEEGGYFCKGIRRHFINGLKGLRVMCPSLSQLGDMRLFLIVFFVNQPA